MGKQKVFCECGGKMIPIVYGMPSAKLFRKADMGKVILGGCIVDLSSPCYECKKCGRRI